MVKELEQKCLACLYRLYQNVWWSLWKFGWNFGRWSSEWVCLWWVIEVGYKERYLAPNIGDKVSAGGHNYKLTGMGVELAINDAVSVSYSEEESVKRSYGAAVNAAAGKSPFTRTEVAFESTFLMLAYDIGGATVGLTSVESSNSGYVSGADTTKTLATMSMAF